MAKHSKTAPAGKKTHLFTLSEGDLRRVEFTMEAASGGAPKGELEEVSRGAFGGQGANFIPMRGRHSYKLGIGQQGLTVSAIPQDDVVVTFLRGVTPLGTRIKRWILLILFAFLALFVFKFLMDSGIISLDPPADGTSPAGGTDSTGGGDGTGGTGSATGTDTGSGS